MQRLKPSATDADQASERSRPKPRLLFVVNVDWFFASHRLPIALAAQKAGYEVHLATTFTDRRAELQGYGFALHDLKLERSSVGPLATLVTWVQLLRLFRRLRPSLVHLVTIKPVILGGIAARFCRVPAVVSAISGLGVLFGAGRLAAVLRPLVLPFYRLALGHSNQRLIFQNPSDQSRLTAVGRGIGPKSVRVRGSGVDLNSCRHLPEPEGVPVVSMSARLLYDKGVVEFIDAAKLLAQRGCEAEFWLIGDLDPANPSSVREADLEGWREEQFVKLLGFRSDVPRLYAESNIVVLPSYSEGLPKCLVEAAACGRAVVTTDVPGCRDAIVEGETGLLVPPRDAVALADAIQSLLDTPQLRVQMGQRGRQLAEECFDIAIIVRQHLDIYAELLGRARAKSSDQI